MTTFCTGRLCGEQEILQCHRRTIWSPESLTLICTAESYVQTKFGDNDTLYLSMPSAFVGQTRAKPELNARRGARAMSPRRRAPRGAGRFGRTPGDVVAAHRFDPRPSTLPYGT